MITVAVAYGRDGEGGPEISRIHVTGHAGAGEYGRDLVCAAVSALVINFINSSDAVCGVPLSARVAPGDVAVEVDGDRGVQLLARSLVDGVTRLAAEHDDFIRVLPGGDRGRT